jgi:benzodiazapine receptor
MKNILKLILCIGVCQLAGVIGSFYTMDSIPTWYAALNKPALNPPNWIFGPVWITLYTLMGISLYIVWKKGMETPGVKSGMVIFFIQLIFNTAWSIVFFGSHNIFGALIVIIILWLMILLTIVFFHRLSSISAYLLIPYILWVSFAAYLNYSIYVLN